MTSCGDPDFPRVLLITRNHPPLRGGMERLNARMFEALHSRNPTSALLGPPGAGRFVPEGACSGELADGSLMATILSSMTRGMGMARRTRPRVVLAEGEYRVIARNEGKMFERGFNVVTGVDGEIDVLAR